MCRKLGLVTVDDQGFQRVRDLMELMHQGHVDFTLAFRLLADDIEQFKGLFSESAAIESWFTEWSDQLVEQGENVAAAQERMRLVNPAVIPRNHRVEEAIRAAEDHNDFTLTHRLIDVLKTPYAVQPENEEYMTPPESDEVVHQTFCGT